MSEFKFKWRLDNTDYTFVYNEHDNGGIVVFYDCGWEYNAKYTEEEVKKNLDSGEWVIIEEKI